MDVCPRVGGEKHLHRHRRKRCVRLKLIENLLKILLGSGELDSPRAGSAPASPTTRVDPWVGAQEPLDFPFQGTYEPEDPTAAQEDQGVLMTVQGLASAVAFASGKLQGDVG